MKVTRARLAAWAAFVALTAGLIPLTQHSGLVGAPLAAAQNMGQRNVTGSVVDDTSTPVAGATVFLKNQKTKSIRSYTSAANGQIPLCAGEYGGGLRSLGGKGWQEKQHQDRKFLGCTQGIRNGAENEVRPAGRICRSCARLNPPASSSPAHSAAPGWPAPSTPSSPGPQRIPPSSSCRRDTAPPVSGWLQSPRQSWLRLPMHR